MINQENRVESFAPTPDYAETLAKIKMVFTRGNLASLTDDQRFDYYISFCESAGLNPVTRPIEFLELGKGKDKKLVPYATKNCAEQLRKIHNISCNKVEHRREDGLYIVTVYVSDKHGRTDCSTAVIPFIEPPTIKLWNDGKKAYDFKENPNSGKPLDLNEIAVVIMKTETKAKRRATLSISGLGILDETEIESISLTENINNSSPTVKKISAPVPEDYKIPNNDKEELITPDQKDRIIALCEKVKKGNKNLIDEYIKKVLRVRFGHDDLDKISQPFADRWIEKLTDMSSTGGQ